jgi:membrane protease YdiL (CAAX protease family)
MPELRDSPQSRIAKLGILIALALGGQLFARWIADSYVTNLSPSAQSASVAFDLILLACVPFGFFLTPSLSLPGTPLLDRWMHREHALGEFNRTLYRSLVLALISLTAALAVAMIPHHVVHTANTDPPVPVPLDVLLAVAAALREEVEFRLGLLSVLAWLINQASRALSADRKSMSLWTANFLQAMVFGALHQLAGFTGRTSTMSLASVILEPRTIGGLFLGYAYVRYGLECAIMMHAFGDASIFALATLFARLQGSSY